MGINRLWQIIWGGDEVCPSGVAVATGITLAPTPGLVLELFSQRGLCAVVFVILIVIGPSSLSFSISRGIYPVRRTRKHTHTRIALMPLFFLFFEALQYHHCNHQTEWRIRPVPGNLTHAHARTLTVSLWAGCPLHAKLMRLAECHVANISRNLHPLPLVRTLTGTWERWDGRGRSHFERLRRTRLISPEEVVGGVAGVRACSSL